MFGKKKMCEGEVAERKWKKCRAKYEGKKEMKWKKKAWSSQYLAAF